MNLVKLFSRVLALSFLVLVSCNKATDSKVLVSTKEALYSAISEVKPGTEIVLANGTYTDVNIVFKGEGTKEAPIVLRAETPGKVFIEGVSNVQIGGSYLVIDGLYFRKGYSPTKNVIAFRLSEKEVATNCRVTNCVIIDFNQLERDKDDLWVQLYGRHNSLDHCYIAGKTNGGPTVRVDLKGNQSIRNFHKITNNHFGPRPRKGGARGETIQLGSSYTSMSPSNTLIANNLFEECNGEVEVISSKTNFNVIKNNVFYKCEGSVVTRHGNYVMIDGNYFIGDGVNKNVGGIRIINTGHWIVNNYFYNLIGENFRSPLAVMNGIPKSPLNRYNQVTDVVVAYNTYVNCKSPWQFGVGTNISQKEVLPLSEIRSARALRTEVVNNVIFNTEGDAHLIVEHDKADGVTFMANAINNQGVDFKNKDKFIVSNFELKKVSEELFVPVGISTDITPYTGFGFEAIKTDLFGVKRENSNSIGALVSENIKDPVILDKTKYGASWFVADKATVEAKKHEVTAAKGDLEAKIAAANSGDILELNAGTYAISNSLKIDKQLTIKSKDGEKAIVVADKALNSPLFQLNPYGILTIENVKLEGSGKQAAFASLKENMFNHFGLFVTGCEINNFNYVLKAYKQSFAEEIAFTNTSILNCENGIELSEETNDRGDYNVEFLTIDNCVFTNVKSNVIDYYRGGYDESTIGGNLMVKNSTFKNCGAKEKNGILLNTRGIVNVAINNNTFTNNNIKLVALLWGAKNNTELNNKLQNSGVIRVEENLKMKLMY
ncbi:poly(beta-D-mannuronate) lyase [Lutibacter oricola]|uniref:Poly(Beta-D-mannuronate) lyase n=1 Tax=Lutibacter oricola TaxID=762486 RepID=A0A1H3FTQ1_9FLAO|nr:chondroitinase-B domain-containing protein [Lutibacter oricola]SDX93519.1 poly(beta-D-mannuronate) lyase [Lutibacter oricola]